ATTALAEYAESIGRYGLGRRAPRGRLQRVEIAHEVLFLLCRQLQPQDEVEVLDGIIEREQAAVVQIRGAVFDAAEREDLRRSAVRHLASVDDLVLVVELLGLQVVHEVVAEDRRRMAFRAAGLAEEKRLAAKLLLRRELGIETAERVELRSRREIED